MSNNMKFENGRLKFTMSQHFNVLLGPGVNPSICPTIEFDLTPEEAAKFIWDSYIVKARQATLKGYTTAEALLNATKGKHNYAEFLSKAAMKYNHSLATMTKDELMAEKAKLEAMIAEK